MRNFIILILLIFAPQFSYAECVKSIVIKYNTGHGWSNLERVQVRFLTSLEMLNQNPYFQANGEPSFYAIFFTNNSKKIVQIPNYDVVDATFSCSQFSFLNSNVLVGRDQYGKYWSLDVAGISSSSNNGNNLGQNPVYKQKSYRSPIDIDQHNKTMSDIQNRADKQRAIYNSLTTQEKRSIQKYNDYKRQNEWVRWQMYNKTRKIGDFNEKDLKRLKKESKSNLKKLAFKKHLNLEDLEDGWHRVIGILPNNLHIKRYIRIKDNEITAYLGRHNLIFFDFEYSKNAVGYKLSISGSGESGTVSFYIPEDSFVKKTPKYEVPVMLIIKTDSHDNPELYVFNSKIKAYLGKLNKYYGSSSSLDCNISANVIRIPLPPGKYEYAAATDTKYWNNKFKLDNSNSCKIISLSE